MRIIAAGSPLGVIARRRSAASRISRGALPKYFVAVQVHHLRGRQRCTRARSSRWRYLTGRPSSLRIVAITAP
jgi:hypothetical protein